VQFDLGSILAAIFIPLTALHVLPFTIRASGPIVHFFTIACCIGGSGVLVLLR
jgi:CDP-diacylglycerol--serine O-phosphatidyltransferase